MFIPGRLKIRNKMSDNIENLFWHSTRPFDLELLHGHRARWVAPTHRALKKIENKMKRNGIEIGTRRSGFIEWNYEAEVYALGKRLNEHFDDLTLRMALTDNSYVHQERQKQLAIGVEEPAISLSSNKKIAQTGLAIIKEYCPKYLRSALPLFPEEGIMALCDHLTSDIVLEQCGLGIGLKDLILCQEYPPSTETVSRAFQGVVAALNESSGQDRVFQFIQEFVIVNLVGKDFLDIWKVEDPQKELSELLVRSGCEPAEPRLIFESGKNTILAVYQVGMYSNKELIGIGYGETIDVAYSQATHDALRRVFQATANANPLPFSKKAEKIELKDSPNVSLSNLSISDVQNIITC
ncbi:mitochondrial ribosomal protein L44 isoform X3 [Oratosquilla oratoria]|uniref:mitochondrial ribosomal protein L44 isoform X3 n=1 Tax=Oratosquilla oratoria TaxID=337810 RepID=UPI003F765B28